MSITAIPLSVPGWAIFIAVLLTVASMWPSTTSMSQFEISAPLSLMFGPTESLLPAVSAISGAGAELSFIGVARVTGLFSVGMGGRDGNRAAVAPGACASPVVPARAGPSAGLYAVLGSKDPSPRPRFSILIPFRLAWYSAPGHR